MRTVVALGGNALLRRGEPAEAAIQRAHVLEAAPALAALALHDELVITHGNGPQVGLLALEAEAYKDVTPYPLDVLGAETQGLIGYLLVQAIRNQLARHDVVTLLTQVRVDPDDPAFLLPTKPIGPVYSEREARQLAESRGWSIARDGNDFRRVVASPEPQAIVELHAIKRLLAGQEHRHLRRRRRHPRRCRPRRSARSRRGHRQGPHSRTARRRARCRPADHPHRCPSHRARLAHSSRHADRLRDARRAAPVVVRARIDGPEGRGCLPFRRAHRRRSRHRRASGSRSSCRRSRRNPHHRPACRRASVVPRERCGRLRMACGDAGTSVGSNEKLGWTDGRPRPRADGHRPRRAQPQ